MSLLIAGKIRKRKKKPSKQFREQFGHTPLSVAEKIPWKCNQLVIGTNGRLPVMEEVKQEAERRKIELLVSRPRSRSSRYGMMPRAPMQFCL